MLVNKPYSNEAGEQYKFVKNFSLIYVEYESNEDVNVRR